ncbi:MAG: ribosome-associated translation inhibitor RaiA [Oscillospiraceae bacterium]|jgi:putative sigma-54 modulation protein|nr:ribosome-associated translation inhibitor RaiA [Oscillospiraceae bacterium]
MKFTITEKKVQVSDEMRGYAEKKIGKLDRFFRKESEAAIVFTVERGRYIAEVTLNNNGIYYRVSESTSDMHATIDSAVAAIERQIRKHKTRLDKRLRAGAFTRDVIPAVSFAQEDDETEFNIIRTKSFPLKPMAPEEAILQMNLLGHTFFVFKNQDRDDAFSVVYKRRDGGYGLIADGEAAEFEE